MAAIVSSSKIFPCRWDWCRSTFTNIDDLDTHVKHQHIWPMKPMRRTDIALMRRIDLQSLHSSFNTESSIFPGGSIPSQDSRHVLGTSTQSSVPLRSTPPRRGREGSEDFNTFEQLSSPIQATSPPRLPASPALEGLVRQDTRSGLTAAIEKFERRHDHKSNPHLPLTSRQLSPARTPLSQSSVSSQDVVERELTQEDDVDMSLHRDALFPSPNSQQSEPTEPELQWPDDAAGESPGSQSHVVPDETRDQEQLVPSQRPGSPQGSTRGQQFRSGSLTVSLGVNDDNVGPSGSKSHSSPAHSTQPFHGPGQPFALQTQAPYFSQTMDWSQSQ